jgi:pimeloyl-ACP methyl ester carboxylesterase
LIACSVAANAATILIMRIAIQSLLIACCVLTAVAAGTDTASPVAPSAGHVVLLHGLARSSSSMKKLQSVLRANGYEVCNVDYPSREHSIEVLASDFVAPAIAKCFSDNEPVNFVTHSLGGIVVRQLAATKAVANIGRVVMLSPPNHGSELVDKLGSLKLFDWINGPAGKEIGTDSHSLPIRLGPATFELGIITGDRSINPFLSMLIPGDNDGKVAVDHAKLDGMKDFTVLHCSHPYIMKCDPAIVQTLQFLKHGEFRHAATDKAIATSATQPEDCWD